MSRRLARLAILAIICTLSAICGATAGSARAATPQTLTGKIGQADYRIQVPDPWNGTLVLYSHGYVVPGQPNPPYEVSDPVTGAALLAQGYALAGTSYGGTGWAVEQALQDQIAVLDLFASQVGPPKRTIAWGDSLGGMVTAGLVQRNPGRFAGALPMCGVLMGGVAVWNGALDAQFAFKQLFAPNDPALQLVRIADPNANLQRALGLLDGAQRTPAGRARLALVASLNQTPDWYETADSPPARDDYAARQQNQARWFTSPDFAFSFNFRAEMESRAGGNPSFNLGVSYRDLFDRSNKRDIAVAFYREAGLDLDADLRAIDAAPRINADPQALDYLRKNIVFDGSLGLPVLTMHTTADGLVATEGEQAYADVVKAAGNAGYLRQALVNRAGHCAFTPAERLAAFAALVKRIDTGSWDDAALTPEALNAAATALGPPLNVLLRSGGKSAPAAFVLPGTTPFLRPFDARSTVPPPAPPPTGNGGTLPGLPNTGAGGGHIDASPDGAVLIGIAVSVGGGYAWRRRRRAA